MRAYAFFETDQNRAKLVANLIRSQWGKKVQVDTVTAGPFAYGVVVVTNNYRPETFGEIFDQIKSFSDVKTSFHCTPEDLSRA